MVHFVSSIDSIAVELPKKAPPEFRNYQNEKHKIAGQLSTTYFHDLPYLRMFKTLLKNIRTHLKYEIESAANNEENTDTEQLGAQTKPLEPK